MTYHRFSGICVAPGNVPIFSNMSWVRYGALPEKDDSDKIQLILCVQLVIWTPRKLFFDSLDTQKFGSGFANDDNFRR